MTEAESGSGAVRATDEKLASVDSLDGRGLHDLVFSFAECRDPRMLGKAVQVISRRRQDLPPSALHNLALLHRQIGEPEQALDLLEEAASMSDPVSLFKLGKHYEYSVENGLERALDYYRRAAEIGHVWSKKRLLHHRYRVRGGIWSALYWIFLCIVAAQLSIIMLRNKDDSRLIN